MKCELEPLVCLHKAELFCSLLHFSSVEFGESFFSFLGVFLMLKQILSFKNWSSELLLRSFKVFVLLSSAGGSERKGPAFYKETHF